MAALEADKRARRQGHAGKRKAAVAGADGLSGPNAETSAKQGYRRPPVLFPLPKKSGEELADQAIAFLETLTV
ncbi:hypothetical protein, partial [uncultured Sphingomonas sp.]|uniref:hypothetical protein n=1 Tax=uncultured Sphingomonas sp. TaxID=158754 RepID=UPI0025D673F8